MPTRYAKTRDVERKYDADAVYDSRYKDIQFEKYDMLLANVVRESRRKGVHYPAISDSLREIVVDVGCGSGLLPSYFSDRDMMDGMRFVGVDISGGLLGVGRSKFSRHPGISFLQATADLLPFRDGISSVVFSISTYQNLDPEQQSSFFGEVRRILPRQRAIFLFSFLDKPPLSDDIEAIIDLLEKKFDSVKLLGHDPRIEDRLIVCSDATDF